MRFRVGHPLPILVGLALVVAALASPPPAAAHARLASSTPANGAALPAMPSEVVLGFSEPVGAGSARVSLTTTLPNATPLEAGDPVVDGQSVRFALRGAPPEPQTVTVAWRVVSGTDGHETTGLLIFSVGTGIPPRIALAGTSENPSGRSVALRGVGLLGLVLLATAVAGGWLGDRSGRRMAVIGVALLMLSITIDVADRDLVGSASGQLLVGSAVTALLILPAVWACRPTLGVVPWLLAVAAVVAAGHAAGDSDRLLGTLVGVAHAALGLAWAGGIVALAIVSRHGDRTAALRRVGTVAVAGVALLAVAGVALTALRVDGLRSLGDQTYGRLVVAKQALLAAAIATAAVNRLVLIPRVSNVRWATATRPVLFFEAVVLTSAVAVAAALSSTPPADGPRAVPVATRAIAIDEAVAAGELDLRVASLITGAEDDRLLVTVHRRGGASAGAIQRLIVAASVTRPGELAPTPVSRTDATPVAETGQEATFSFPATGLAVSGVWSLELIVRRDGIEDASGVVQIDTTTWSFQPPRLVRDGWRWPSVPPSVPVLLVTAAVVVAVGFAGVRRSRTIEPLPAVILLAAIVAITAGFTVQALQQIDAAPADHGAEPPAVAPDLVAAAADYRTYCLACHGVAGGGVDDTDPLHDHGSGTDLLDVDTRDRSDGDLFALIGGGVSGTTMPAYDLALTDGERWALVAYLRSLQRDRPEPTATP